MRVLILGAGGGLGRVLTKTLRAKGWSAIGADVASCPAEVSQAIKLPAEPKGQVAALVAALGGAGGQKLDAIVNCSGGFAMANAASEDLLDNAHAMVQSSYYASLVSARVASSHLRPGGLLVLPGAAAAPLALPGLLPYVPVKAAVHSLVRGVAANPVEAGLPADAKVVALAPITLDTPMNREAMPDADHSSWTPLEVVGDEIVNWIGGSARGGAIYEPRTAGGSTTFVDVSE